jgi:hypothetical protein
MHWSADTALAEFRFKAARSCTIIRLIISGLQVFVLVILARFSSAVVEFSTTGDRRHLSKFCAELNDLG